MIKVNVPDAKSINDIVKTIGVFTIVIIKMLGLVFIGWKPVTGILFLLYLFL